MKVRNPRNGNYDYEFNEDLPVQVSEKALYLRAHQEIWAAKGIEHRVNVLLEFAERLLEQKESVLHKLSVDTGRKKITAIEFEGVIGLIKGRCYTAQAMMEPEAPRNSISNPEVEIRQQLIPYELVGVISPWNFPLLLSLIDVVPALLSGASALLKPSEVTPRFIDPLEDCISVTPGLSQVFGVLRGGAKTGKALIESVDAVCFTGSVETGLKIAERCAQRFIPAFLELGGKDAAIVCEDADLELSTDAILRSAAGATGQACQSLERIYTNKNIMKPFLDLLVSKCNACTFNNDYKKGGTLGPLIFEKQAEKIKIQIEDAVEKGAQVLCGGEVKDIDGGLWMMPTVINQVDHSMLIMTEETFGPIIPVMTFDDIDEAIKLANESKYGLSASVFSANIEKACKIASKINAGGISINDGSLTNQVYDATKNSFKLSGINGSRMGKDGFTRFFRKKALLIQKGKPASIHSQEEN